MEGEDLEEQEMRARIERAKQRVLDGEDVGLEELAKEAGWSKWHFGRLFKKMVGLSPRDLRDQMRAQGEAEQHAAEPSATGALATGGNSALNMDWSALERFEMPQDDNDLAQAIPDLESTYPGLDYEAFFHGVSPTNSMLADLFPETFHVDTLPPDMVIDSKCDHKGTTGILYGLDMSMWNEDRTYDSSIPSLVDCTAESASSAGLTSLSTPSNGLATPIDISYCLESLPMPILGSEFWER